MRFQKEVVGVTASDVAAEMGQDNLLHVNVGIFWHTLQILSSFDQLLELLGVLFSLGDEGSLVQAEGEGLNSGDFAWISLSSRPFLVTAVALTA